jgi:hypothetical protein
MISNEQFDKIAQDLATYGGFSAKVAGSGATGEGPAGDAYMVGGYKGLLANFPPEPALSGADLGEWSKKPEQNTALSEPNIYLGGWTASNPQRQSLDVTEAFNPRKTGEPYKARIATAERNQEAYGVIRGGDYSGEVNYPYYIPGAPQTGRNPDLFDAAWSASRGGGQTDEIWNAIKQAAPETSPTPKKSAPKEKKYNPAMDPNAMQIPGMEGA